MRRFTEAQDLAEREGLTFAEAMRLLAGADGHRGRRARRGCRLVAGDGRSLAGRDAEGAAQPRMAPASIPARP